MREFVMVTQIALAVGILGAIGLILGGIIGTAVRFFGVELDPRLEQVEDLLPGVNCGACGSAGCSDFARSLLAEEGVPENCPSCEPEARKTICELLGITAQEVSRKVAVVACAGDNGQAKMAAHYNGVNDCGSAVLVAGGVKGCLYGCLGLGSCVRACPFDAIEITDGGIAFVHPELCTGCGSCIEACPRDIIGLVPKSVQIHVLCNSPEKGGAKRKVCKAACIGCRKCVKAAEDDQMMMDGFLARVNYENPPALSVAEECPTGCIHVIGAGVEKVTQTEETGQVVDA